MKWTLIICFKYQLELFYFWQVSRGYHRSWSVNPIGHNGSSNYPHPLFSCFAQVMLWVWGWWVAQQQLLAPLHFPYKYFSIIWLFMCFSTDHRSCCLVVCCFMLSKCSLKCRVLTSCATFLWTSNGDKNHKLTNWQQIERMIICVVCYMTISLPS